MEKHLYIPPLIRRIELDMNISLQYASQPPEEPNDWTYNGQDNKLKTAGNWSFSFSDSMT